MCGIVGIVSPSPMKLSKNLYLANCQMRRRGPDDEGYVLFNKNGTDICFGEDTTIDSLGDRLRFYPRNDIKTSFDNKYNVALAHRRLSIVDLSAHGHQPMCDESGRFWITFNGEVYNFKEIRKELIELGHNFFSRTDTEVILKSFLEWKEQCLQKFNGDFAFAIFDNQQEEIFLARDRVGIKPLYYTFQNGVFIFASDIKTIIASGLYSPKINWEGMYHNFSFSMAPRPNTVFKDVYALKQGHFLVLNCRTLDSKITEYWDIPTNIQNSSMSEYEAVELLEEELTKSIRYRLMSDVSVGTFMSGGIDSTTISAIASKIHPNIKAFTLAFDKSISKYDELEQAKATARMHDMKHIISTLDADVVLKNIRNMVLCYEEPFQHLAANFAISEVVRNSDVKVVLNGLGGDELFAGYGYYGRIPQWRMLSRFGPLVNLIPEHLHPQLGAVKKYARSKDAYQYYASAYSNYTDLQKKDLFKQEFNSLGEIAKQYHKHDKSFSDDLELLSYLDMKSYIGNHHVHRTDQFTMHFSLEGRFPFLDHNLVEKAFTIPSKFKLRGGVHKYALRQVAQKHIAPECLSMNKKGFGLPLEYWFNNQLKEIVQSSISSLRRRDLFWDRGIESVMSSGSITQKWQLVMFELWYQEFIEPRAN